MDRGSRRVAGAPTAASSVDPIPTGAAARSLGELGQALAQAAPCCSARRSHRPLEPLPCAPHAPTSTHPVVIERILALRDELPSTLHRTPGPRTLQYYLAHDPTLAAWGHALPPAPSTIWRILRQYGRIVPRVPHPKEPLDRPPPLTAWQLDFKDASTVPADPDGKRQHVVEVLNTIDTGTSILLDAQVRGDFVADTALEAVAALVQQQGLPQQVTFDRDTRFVGSATQRDFPSAFIRFWLCLGVQVDVCPPHRPDRNAFVMV